MNIAGVTQTQVLPQAQPTQQSPGQTEEFQTALSNEMAAEGADAVNLSAQMSTQVMDIAQRQFEDAANDLIASMAAASGLGQTVDVSV